MNENQFDIIIIGSGPGGYVAAIKAAQLGMKTAVVEKENLGGICLNWGCIPTKALLKSAQVFNYTKHLADYGIEAESGISANLGKMVERSRGVSAQMSKGVEYLLKKNKVEVISGFAKLLGNHKISVKSEDETKEFEAKHIIIATGARSKEMPFMKQDGKHIIGYREALILDKKPKTMLIAGSGAIGCEFAYFYQSIGCDVTIVEYLPQIAPLEDEEVSKQLARSFKKMKIKVKTGTAVKNVSVENGKCKVKLEGKKGEEEMEVDVVLSAVGVSPNVENIGLEELGIDMEKGKIKVNEFYETNIKGIYAIGDVIDTPALAHVASHEAILCVEKIAGKQVEAFDYSLVPSCVYTSPEIASVGMTEKTAIEKEIEIKVGKFPFQASGKAKAAGTPDGFIKVIVNAKDDSILGVHMIGENVTEMISEIVVAKSLNAKGKDIAHAMHPHPTMSEAMMEAAAAAYGEAVHIV